MGAAATDSSAPVLDAAVTVDHDRLTHMRAHTHAHTHTHTDARTHTRARHHRHNTLAC